MKIIFPDSSGKSKGGRVCLNRPARHANGVAVVDKYLAALDLTESGIRGAGPQLDRPMDDSIWKQVLHNIN